MATDPDPAVWSPVREVIERSWANGGWPKYFAGDWPGCLADRILAVIPDGWAKVDGRWQSGWTCPVCSSVLFDLGNDATSTDDAAMELIRQSHRCVPNYLQREVSLGEREPLLCKNCGKTVAEHDAMAYCWPAGREGIDRD